MRFCMVERSLCGACSWQNLAKISTIGRPRPRTRALNIVVCRSYATTQNGRVTTSSLLSSALEQKQRTAQREDYAGPFQLGLVPPTTRDSGSVKKWSELSAAGKVARTTERTTNLAVILAGAGLSAMLIYALTSELFSKNSATVLYGQACDKLKASPQLAKYLQPPFAFHNNPPSAVRPRHRNHQVSSQIVLDQYGKEHMLLHFYVEGRPPGSSPPDAESESYADRVKHWSENTAARLSDMSYDEMVQSVKARVEAGMETAKSLFRFLSGDPVPRAQQVQPPQQQVKEKEEAKGWATGFTGLFSGLRGTTRSARETRSENRDSAIHTEGEVHVDLIMNDKGFFEFRYLFVDIPNSRAWSSKRVIVERADGVRDNEPTLSWHS